MKHKTKLIATLMAMCLVITLGVFGILAVKTLNMSVGGNITFSADGLDFSISDGTFETTAGAEYPGVNSDTTKLKGFAMNTNTKESDVATQKASWSGLNLTMSSLGDVVLVFTVTNNMTENLVTTIEVTTLGTNTNNNMEINVIGGTVTKGTPKEMSITFHIKDTNINAGLTGFAVAVSFAKDGASEPGATQSNPVDATTLPNLKFTPTTGNSTSVENNGSTGDVVIPAYVKIGTTTYAVTEIEQEAFFNSSITSVSIPNTITEIRRWAFKDCKDLKEIVISGTVKTIMEGAFSGSSLESVIIEEGVESIESYSFANTKISTIKIPKSVTQMYAWGAFENCTNLKIVYIDCELDVALGNQGTCLFNNTEFVYIHKDVTVSNSAFTKVGQEGDYYKYTETITQTYSGGSAD